MDGRRLAMVLARQCFANAKSRVRQAQNLRRKGRVMDAAKIFHAAMRSDLARACEYLQQAREAA